jgi:NAD(P)H-hydrate epimerase
MRVGQIRAVDRIAIQEFGMTGLVLMENAGRGAADAILGTADASQAFAIVCGAGNNGGDGLVIARHLHAHGAFAQVWILGERDRLSPDTATNLAILERTRVPIEILGADASDDSWTKFENKLARSGTLVDAMLGTGATGAPRGGIGRAIHACNRTEAFRIAIDIPSGLDAETGTAHTPTFHAQLTLTFVAPKIGFDHPNARKVLGEIRVLPIGVPPEVLERAIQDRGKSE